PWHFNALLNITGDISLFVPFGFLIPLLFKNLNRTLKMFALGCITTLAVEVSQMAISYMVGLLFAVLILTTLMLNTLGAIIGFM
ncbi:MAG: VanZ family protein, partial [Gorillibacterium sp.]|nr:VanZ family protein [Gorillibacterium sp.]